MIQKAEQPMGMPARIHGSFPGISQACQSSLASQPFLILTALAAVYIVLGILYDSYLNVITAQTALLNNRRTAATLRFNRVSATVLLIKALGGGWDTSRLTGQ